MSIFVVCSKDIEEWVCVEYIPDRSIYDCYLTEAEAKDVLVELGNNPNHFIQEVGGSYLGAI